MGNNKKNNVNHKVSALETTLKLLCSFLKRIKYYAGLLLIDRLMRNIVYRYDIRHPKPTRNRKKNVDIEIRRLNTIIDNIQSDYDSLLCKYDEMCSESANQSQRISEYSAIIESTKADSLGLTSDNLQLSDKVQELRAEIDLLKRRCLPETDLPSMIYYATGDASGLWLRKVSASREKDHIYKLETNQGDTATASFRPFISGVASDVISNRNITLIACEIMSIESPANTITVVEDGIAILDNNKWKVTRKAKIKIQ